jgi:hypothetical protein
MRRELLHRVGFSARRFYLAPRERKKLAAALEGLGKGAPGRRLELVSSLLTLLSLLSTEVLSVRGRAFRRTLVCAMASALGP